MAEGGADPYESLYPAPEILTCHPVTATDLRLVALDVDGVENAWIEPVEAQRTTLHYHPTGVFDGDEATGLRTWSRQEESGMG